MIPGNRGNEGLLYLVEAAPGLNDPRAGGFALTLAGEVYATRVPVTFLTPADLFANGEPGDYWDDTDRSSMFADVAMTTPAVIEGLVAAQVGGANGIVATSAPGQEPRLSARYNRMVNTDDLKKPGWILENVSGSTSDRLVEDTNPNVLHRAYQDIVELILGFVYAEVKPAGRNWASIQTPAGTAWFDILNGVLGYVDTTVTATITPLPDGYFAITARSNNGTTSQYPIVTVSLADQVNEYTGDGVSGIFLRNMQYVTQGQSTLPYQRTGDTLTTPGDYDADPLKFPSYLVWSGAQAQQTPVVDFSSTNSITAFAGFVGNTTTAAIIMELGPDANIDPRTFFLASPDQLYRNGYVVTDATARAVPATGLANQPPPSTQVVTLQGFLEEPRQLVRGFVNGVYDGENSLADGTGPFSATDKLNFCAREGLIAPFIGTSTARIVRGAASTDDEIRGMERWIAARMPGAVLAAPLSGAPPAPYSNANSFLFDGLGRLCVTLTDPIAGWAGGLPFTDTGVLVITDLAPDASTPFVGGLRVRPEGVCAAGVIPFPRSFSDGFDGGFQ